MREGDELNTPKSEEVEMDWLMKEFDELHRRSRNQEKPVPWKHRFPPDCRTKPHLQEQRSPPAEPGATVRPAPCLQRIDSPRRYPKITTGFGTHGPLEITDETPYRPGWRNCGRGKISQRKPRGWKSPQIIRMPPLFKEKAPLSIGDVVFYLVLIAVVVGVLFISGKESGPKSFAGYSAFTVLSGSMESEIPKRLPGRHQTG
ncbi:MAG: hypothetical protein ACLR23_05460 [Clostridia bacterium]